MICQCGNCAHKDICGKCGACPEYEDKRGKPYYPLFSGKCKNMKLTDIDPEGWGYAKDEPKRPKTQAG